MCVPEKGGKKPCIRAEMAAMYACLYVCCISLYMYMYVFTMFKLICVCPLYSAKSIDDVVLNKK